jgi:hypothetical protein
LLAHLASAAAAAAMTKVGGIIFIGDPLQNQRATTATLELLPKLDPPGK